MAGHQLPVGYPNSSGGGFCMLAVLTIAAPLIWVLDGVIKLRPARVALERAHRTGHRYRRGAGQRASGHAGHRGRRRDHRRYCRRSSGVTGGIRPWPQWFGVEGRFRGAGRHPVHRPRLRRLYCVGGRPALAVLVGGALSCCRPSLSLIAKATESALRQVPTAYREGADGLVPRPRTPCAGSP